MASIYVHIPFCQSRCIYCDFFSTTSLKMQEQYVDCLEKELRLRQTEWPLHARTLSIYIGGGTPSTLPPVLIQRILQTIYDLYPVDSKAEVTIEANPDDITPTWIEGIQQTPVNRISMGVQSFDNEILKTIRRRHTSEQVIAAVHLLQKAGYKNLSIDLIYGLPGQTVNLWQKDLQQAISLNIPHISAYSLMFEEGTPITRMRDKGELTEMSEEDSIRCYELLCETLKNVGYEHYEISNFCLPNMYSRHNSAYWTGAPYLGFGAGAHSYDGENIRRWNNDSLTDYLQTLSEDSPEISVSSKSLNKKGTADSCFCTETLSQTDLYNEFIMTRLRTAEGFLLNELEERFGQKALIYCKKMAAKHLAANNLIQEENRIHLSEKGVFISNDIISDLFL